MKRSFPATLFLLLGTVFTVLWPMAAKADVTASILGTVTDGKGNVVPGASVTLSNSTTGLKRTLVTDGNGQYQFLSVPVGDSYQVEVSAPGFAKNARSGITLAVNQSFRADFSLSIGQVSEQVTAAADAVQVDTTTNQLGDVITDDEMISLPLNGRSYTDLLGLQPGVVPITSSAAFTDRPVSGGLNPGEVSVNGSQESGNSFLINGGDVEEPKNSGASVIPSLDSIEEFRIVTNSFDAEYGRFGGAIVNVITKSGSNAFHGSVYEFVRNEDFNGKNYFSHNQTDPSTGQQIPNTARGVYKRNQFGYAFGGPVFKNHAFFFSDYQGTRQDIGEAASTAFVPSTQETTGDFTDSLVTNFGQLTGTVQGDPSAPHSMPVTLTQRLGYTVTSGEPYWFDGCSSTSQCVFPNQKVPQSAWDPAATAILKFIPAPNGASGTTPFYSTTALRNTLNDDKYAERLTWNEHVTGDWSFYYSHDSAADFDPFAGGNVPGFSGNVPQVAHQANVSNTRVFGPSMVNEVRLNYTRSTIFQTNPIGGLGSLSSFGFGTDPLGLVAAVPSVSGVPNITIDGGYSVSLGAVAYAINEVNNSYQLVDVFSKIWGKHSLKFGGEGRQLQVSEYNISTPNGSFEFNGNETGNGFADYLLGAPDSFNQQSYSTFFTRANYGGFFVQDSYRARPNLTINGGLRYELIQPWYEIRNHLNAIVWGQQSTEYPGSPTGWVFPGDKGIPNTVSKTPHNNFSPRLGINWSPSASDGFLAKLTGGPGKTSVRVGSGLYYTAVEDQPSFYTIGDAPFGLYYQAPTQVYFSEPYKDRLHGNDPGQHFPYSDPKPGTPIDWSIYLPIGGSPGVGLNNVSPYVIHFNFNLQRELPGSAVLSAAYVGTRGHHLLAQIESNPGDAATCLEIAANLPAGQGCGPNGEDQIYTNGLGPGKNAYGTRPHSVTSGRFLAEGLLDFSSNPYNATIVNADYNAFEASLTKHIGLAQFLASYTWSKSIDDGSGDTDAINPFNPKLSRSLSSFDLPQNFVVSYGINSPKFEGQSQLIRKSLGGWELTGITRFTTGLPITLQERKDRSLTGFRDTPDWDGHPVAKLDPRASPTHTYFNASQFSIPALGSFGDAKPRFFHGPGLNNWDMAVRKLIPIHEKISFEFRAEFFNVFNHTQFNNPGGRIASASFGNISSSRDPRIGQIAGRITF